MNTEVHAHSKRRLLLDSGHRPTLNAKIAYLQTHLYLPQTVTRTDLQVLNISGLFAIYSQDPGPSLSTLSLVHVLVLYWQRVCSPQCF